MKALVADLHLAGFLGVSQRKLQSFALLACCSVLLFVAPTPYVVFTACFGLLLIWGRPQGLVLALLSLGAVMVYLSPLLPAWVMRPPDMLIPPLATWLDAMFDFIKGDIQRGEWGLVYITRWVAEGPLQFLLDTAANLLEGKRRWPHIGPVPWVAITGAATVVGYYLGGWRLASFAGGTCVWVALVGQWGIAMQTLSVLAIATPLAFVIGLLLGVAAWRYKWFEIVVQPILSVLQTLPFFTYLLPAVIFFKVGPTAGAIATIIYAIPPMILMTTLGLKKVSPDIVEAGKMAGANRWQMLTKVYIPAARTEILVGLNQVIMLCLAMVVLTAFIGMPGLGAKLLKMMGSFKLGRSFEIGITIVLLAIMLDRLSKAWVIKQPTHFESGTPWWRRHVHLLIGIAVFCSGLIIAKLSSLLPNATLEPGAQQGNFFQWFGSILDTVERRQNLSRGKEIDEDIKAFLDIDGVQAVTEWLRWFLNVWVLIPFRNFLLSIPTPGFILMVVALSLWIGGRRPALYAGVFFCFVALSGWWDRSVITLYTVISAVLLASLIGLPVAVWAARSPFLSRGFLLICDTAQTFPSFIYLIPAIMLFGINDVAVVFSILIFTLVPLVRYTIEGLRAVPLETIEAANMSGASKFQRLKHVEMPLALPTMAVGFNQAIIFAFFMVIIAAFIGTQDLGQELQRTLAGTDLSKNFVLGFNVAFMALAFDLTILAWANRRKKVLGLN